MDTIGERIRQLRKEQGLLIREVAAKLSMDTALLSRIERGERIPKKDQVLKLAKLFKADKDEFLILYLSDKVVSEVKKEGLAPEALKAAEVKVKNLNRKK